MKYKKLIFICSLTFLFTACTDDFQSMNTSPYQVGDESLLQDFNSIGSYFPTMLSGIIATQTMHHLVNDSYVRQLATPTPFIGGVNNTTYYITWNTYWDWVYSRLLSPSYQVIMKAEDAGEPVFVSWAKLIRIIGASRLSAYHGPIIYNNFGSSDQEIMYDSEEVLYSTWFAELDEIVSTFNSNSDYKGLKAFDASFDGKVANWAKVANTVRLQLAMRISKVAPGLAKTEGEKAIADVGGLVETNADNFFISLYGARFVPATIDYSWNDSRMSATMESILIGYEDNRITKYFEPAEGGPELYSDHPDWPYKGIRNGALIESKDDRLGFSHISANFLTVTNRRYLTAAETHFLLAEAALRNWNGALSAKEHYEEGVKLSFEEWGASGADEYLLNDTGTPLDYNDPKASGDVNDFISRIDATVKWDESGSNEEKLEKIMTQKWIASFMNSVEAWVDQRRTGYPKIPYNYKNDSNSTWGIVGPTEFIKRMPFVQTERENNPKGVEDATQKLGGPDLINTPLWWDVEGPNF